jgi:hypothetical protein
VRRRGAVLCPQEGAYDDALTTARMVPTMSRFQYAYLLEIQARRGDLVGADSLVQHLIPPDHAAELHLRLATDAANRGDTVGAFRIARGLDQRAAESVRLETARLMMRHGALADAESTVARAARAGVVVLAVNRREHCDHTDGAAAQFAAGDIDGAIRTLDRGDAGRHAVLVAQWTATLAVTKELAWARARRTPIQKAASLTALAQVSIIHQDSVAGRPFRQTP